MDSPMLTEPVARKRDAGHLEDACALLNTPWQLGRRHKSGVTEQRGIGVLQHGTQCE